MKTSKQLSVVKKVRRDDYYTRYEDIEKEMKNYDISNMIVYCPFDKGESNFVKYFKNNFTKHKIKKLIYSYYDIFSEPNIFKHSTIDSKCYIYDSEREYSIDGNYKFGSIASIEMIKQCDVVISNPPFSLKSQVIQMIRKYNKKFILLLPLTIFTNRNYSIFDYKLGYNEVKKFESIYENKILRCQWVQNLNMDKPFGFKCLKIKAVKGCGGKKYSLEMVKELERIRIKKGDIISLPISYMQYHNEVVFEILGFSRGSGTFERVIIKKL